MFQPFSVNCVNLMLTDIKANPVSAEHPRNWLAYGPYALWALEPLGGGFGVVVNSLDFSLEAKKKYQ